VRRRTRRSGWSRGGGRSSGYGRYKTWKVRMCLASTSSLLSYTPLINSSHTLHSYTPLIHSTHTLYSYSTHHSSHHFSHTLLSPLLPHTPPTHSSHTLHSILLPHTPLIHSTQYSTHTLHSLLPHTPLPYPPPTHSPPIQLTPRCSSKRCGGSSSCDRTCGWVNGSQRTYYILRIACLDTSTHLHSPPVASTHVSLCSSLLLHQVIVLKQIPSPTALWAVPSDRYVVWAACSVGSM
jgi:hypothetical protein